MTLSITVMVKLLIIGLLVGIVAGLVGALCGVGGGIIMVPAFVMALGMGQKMAVATSLAVVVVSGLSGTVNNAVNSDLIQWKVVAVAALGAAMASWYGTDLMRSLSNLQLQKGFALSLIHI